MSTLQKIDFNTNAIRVEHASFHFNKKVKVLDNLNFEAKTGEITALLGPTGAGKTTLIRLVLGRIRLNSGSVSVFGHTPGTPSLAIPGPGVGYMPQELALFDDFTIQQILQYYGLIYHMNAIDAKKRINSLVRLLRLPEKSRPIARLSGGQQRRVSIAVTLLHRPKLVILDEPTVGVDPLLRNDIWQHLQGISRQGQTVVITTHYIEEARNANNVAFMNYGKILEQGDPGHLMLNYHSKTLENVFLLICLNYKKASHLDNRDELIVKLTEPKIEQDNIDNKRINFDWFRFRAIFGKNLSQMSQPVLLVNLLLLIPIIFSLTSLAMDRLPRDNPIALYNADCGNNLSQIFVNSFATNHYIKVNEYPNNESAFDSVVRGLNRISLVIPRNFSDNFELRIREPLVVTDEELSAAQFFVSVDGTDIASNFVVWKELFRALREFFAKAGHILVGYDLSDYFNTITVKENFFGDFRFNLSQFMMPGIVVNTIYFINMLISSHLLAHFKKGSSYERTLVAGVTKWEYMLAHFATTILLALIPIIEAIVLTHHFFQYELSSSILVTLFILMFLLVLQGWSLGYFIGNLIITFTMFVTFGPLSGTFWPRESFPTWLYHLTMLVPTSNPNKALSAIILKSWSYSAPIVQYAFLSCSFFFVFPLITRYKYL